MTLYNTSYAMLQFSSIWNESTEINYLTLLYVELLLHVEDEKVQKD